MNNKDISNSDSHNENSDKRSIAPRDIFKCLWMCRDFELQHLWQRSVFLTAFLTICFAAYGGLVTAMLDGKCIAKANYRLLVNGAAFCISVVGIILSLLWIMMGKASKYWYERYEKAIVAFALSYPDVFSGDMNRLEGMKWENIPFYRSPDVNNSLFSFKAGRYSPSRINTAIGLVSFVVWLGISIVHIRFAAAGHTSLHSLRFFFVTVSDPVAMLVCLLFVLFVFFHWVVPKLKSGE